MLSNGSGLRNRQWEADHATLQGRTPLQRAAISLHHAIKVPIMFGTTVDSTTSVQFRCTVEQVAPCDLSRWSNMEPMCRVSA